MSGINMAQIEHNILAPQSMSIIMKEILTLGGVEKQITILMEELGELAQVINKFYNRKIGYVEDLALEIADVELCLFQIVQILNTSKCNNIMGVNSDFIDINAPLYMAYCHKLGFMVYDYFLGEGIDEDELIFGICNVLKLCIRIRDDIGDGIVNTKKVMKMLHLVEVVENGGDI